MGLIKGFWIIVDLGKNVSYQVAWQEYLTIGIFFLQNVQLIMSSVLNTVEPKALSKYYSLGYSQTLLTNFLDSFRSVYDIATRWCGLVHAIASRYCALYDIASNIGDGYKWYCY